MQLFKAAQLCIIDLIIRALLIIGRKSSQKLRPILEFGFFLIFWIFFFCVSVSTGAFFHSLSPLALVHLTVVQLIRSIALLATDFVMTDDPFSSAGDKISTKHRTATIGRYQADKRRARGNLPTWSEVNAMYADDPLAEEEVSPKSESNKRWTVSVASPSSLDFSDQSCT